uniref:LITAF domain-containing protein n=1 Tax=Onchocerca volvulus TaxID=6282 RepID=A0A2K6VH38_ONCVO
MCCICWFLFGDKEPKICQTCGEKAVEMRFTKLGLLLCIGGSLYCCIGLCCLFLLRERHCPFCYKKSFEEIARVRRRIQCLVDDKSEITVEETEHSDNSS